MTKNVIYVCLIIGFQLDQAFVCVLPESEGKYSKTWREIRVEFADVTRLLCLSHNNQQEQNDVNLTKSKQKKGTTTTRNMHVCKFSQFFTSRRRQESITKEISMKIIWHSYWKESDKLWEDVGTVTARWGDKNFSYLSLISFFSAVILE
jgi:hypothetical protein